ncbi:MAG: hypothetical protein M1834_007280 [Cirrosporium novae-zelandiae]|nr:MAG: hypothetical protein M1834_007280 [Cirrosporium novae-zelandiae]
MAFAAAGASRLSLIARSLENLNTTKHLVEKGGFGQIDVSDSISVKKFFENNMTAPIDILVNSAAQEKPGATAIMTGSMGTDYVTEGWSAYQSGKTSINRIAEFVDAEYGSKGIRSFAYHPGNTWTGMVNGRVPSDLEPLFKDTVELSGGFAVWLTTEKTSSLKGRYVAATWDVEELESIKESILGSDLLKTRVIGGAG